MVFVFAPCSVLFFLESPFCRIARNLFRNWESDGRASNYAVVHSFAAMLETIVKTFVWMLAAYAGAGVLFAIVFVCVGVQRLDSEAQGSGIRFRALIFPGVAAFWPMFFYRWLHGITEPPVEANPHRRLESE